MRDPKKVRNAIIMEQKEIIDNDIYNIPDRHINNDVLVLHRRGATEISGPVVLAVQDCDEEEREILAYRVAKEMVEDKNYRLIPRKVDDYYYILEEIE